MAIAIVEELWTRIRAAIDDKITAAAAASESAVAAAESAEADRVVVEQAATSASWSGDRLTVLGVTSPPLTGDKGDPGADGMSIRPVGTVTDSTALPASADRGEGYVTDDTGHMWVWSGSGWVDVGPLQGPPGEPGRDGVSIWGAIEGKPDVFPPEPHYHTWDQVDGKPVTFPPTTGTTPDTAAPGDHTHSQYATTTQVNARTPEIRIVSSPELATSPGVLYVVREG